MRRHRGHGGCGARWERLLFLTALLFLAAIQFLTRCPALAWVGHSPEQLNQAVRYFPLVGVDSDVDVLGTWGLTLVALWPAG